MFSPLNLFIGIITGGIGAGYFIYGKKQHKFIIMIDGMALCAYPYFTDSLALLIIIGIVLIALPWFFREN
jgi:hypothetical protein